MRTRFLNTDYFTSSSSPIETLSFLNLPVPHLPPPPPPSQQEQHLLSFHPLETISLPIDRPLIDSALFKFIADATPQFIDFDLRDFEPNRAHQKEAEEDLYKQKEEENERVFGTEAQEEDNGNDKHSEGLEAIQFEEPELYTFLENVCFSEEGMQILCEIPETENDLDLLGPEIEMQYPDKVQESVYSVEDVTLEFDMDEKSCAWAYDGSVQEQAHFHRNTFPLLEVEEMSLRTFTTPPMEDEFLLFLEHVESKWTQEDNLHIDGKELLASVQFDILEFFTNHCLSKPCLEPELASLGMDIISMVEILQTREDSADSFSQMNPVVFQEFKFLNMDSSQLYEVFFEMQTTDEPQTCDSMFKEDMNFKNFDELIVSCELTLEDDTFKSLPIPIISDDDKIKSIYSIVEEKLAELKPQPLSASHGIYLDWDLLEEDKYSGKISSFYQNMLEELDSHSIDFDWESFDGRKLVTDLVFSDDGLSGPQMEEQKELLNAISETSNSRLVEGASNKSLDDGGQKPGNSETLIGEISGKASLFKYLSPFNDLDYFLNPGKATARGKSEPTAKVPDTRASFPKEGKSPSVPGPNKNINDQKLEKLLNFLPLEDKYDMISSEAADKAEACCMPVQVPYAPYATKPEKTQGDMVSLPDIVIIVNTQNFDKEMIVSRRSIYQRILAMEKEGAQVVERDLNLPVDVVISSSICLVWYDCGNIGKKATAADEASSCLLLCIENIATNVLTLLSFTFSGCILVFEGEISFLSTVMESSDGLYAAAASLGIDLQLFSSYSAELTNEIILSSILYATKNSRGIYPKMPESESLAESFLTKFPSINPLTAHAILSSGGMLIEFLEWSNERRILAVQQYQVPVESVALFSALCKYGEREDSKSIMTDCSSSASSCHDSDKCHLHIDSERKRRKCTNSCQKLDMHVDDIWQSEPLNQFTDGIRGPEVFKQYDYRTSTDSEILGELKQPSSCLKDLFGQKQVSDIARVMDFPTAMKPLDSGNSNDPLIWDEIRQPRLTLNDRLLGQNRVSEINIKNELELDKSNPSKSNSNNLHEYFIGEVIDITDDPVSLEKDVASIANPTYFSPWMPKIEQDSARKSKAARRLSFGKNSHLNNPTAAEKNFNSDLWTSIVNDRQSLPQNCGHPIMDDNHEKVPVKPRKNLLEEAFTQRAAGNSTRFPFREEISHCGGSGTPLSKAIHSTHPRPGSPWTVEFLNRIREKSRLRQQSLPHDRSTPDFWYSGNISKASKRRSPSILEFFKYQGGSTPRKVHEQKKQKQPIELSRSTQKERTSASLIPTRTPSDKKSKQTLSFEMDDNGSQTRLVWSDGTAHHLRKKFRRN